MVKFSVYLNRRVFVMFSDLVVHSFLLRYVNDKHAFTFYWIQKTWFDILCESYSQRITGQWPNRKRHDSAHPNITSEHEIRYRSSEILTDKKATEYPFDIGDRKEYILAVYFSHAFLPPMSKTAL